MSGTKKKTLTLTEATKGRKRRKFSFPSRVENEKRHGKRKSLKSVETDGEGRKREGGRNHFRPRQGDYRALKRLLNWLWGGP